MIRVAVLKSVLLISVLDMKIRMPDYPCRKMEVDSINCFVFWINFEPVMVNHIFFTIERRISNVQ